MKIMESRGQDSLMKLLLSSDTPVKLVKNSRVLTGQVRTMFGTDRVRRINDRMSMSISRTFANKDQDWPPRLSTYLQKLTGYGDINISSVERDHCYCRPWNWRPENSNTKPVKTLFMSNTASVVRPNVEIHIDVDGDDSDCRVPAYDIGKARQSMDESRKHIHLVRPDTGDSEWESKLVKNDWTLTQSKLFDRAVYLLNNDRLARLTISGHWNEPALRRITMNKTALRFRALYSSIGWEIKLLNWLHFLLMENLDIPTLISYVDVLQTLKNKIPTLIDRILGIYTGTKFNADALNMVLQRPWDPVSHGLACYNPKRLPGNPVILMVPNGVNMPAGLTSRAQKWLSYFAHLGTVSTVSLPQVYPSGKMTVMSHLEHLYTITRSKIYELRSDYIGKNIILVGLNSGASLACQVGLVEDVAAVVCLGFPLNTVDEKRGQPDDGILNLRVPVLFAVGQHATTSSVDDMEDLRERLHVETGLVVVGAADDQLRISKGKQMAEGITQGMVDRCIIDEVGDFLGSILSSPYRNERSRMIADKKRKYPMHDYQPKKHPNTSLSYDTGYRGIKKARPQPPSKTPLNSRNKWPSNSMSSQKLKDASTSTPRSLSGRTPERSHQRPISVENTHGATFDGRPIPEGRVDNMPQIKVLGSEGMRLEDALTLVEELTPDRLLEMPVIIAQDDSNQSPLKVLVNGKTTEIRSPVPSIKCLAGPKESRTSFANILSDKSELSLSKGSITKN